MPAATIAALAARLTMHRRRIVRKRYAPQSCGCRPLWYRARLRTAAGAAGPGLDLNGLTLPGTPLLSQGRTGSGLGVTNSYGKWLDLQRIECLSVTDCRAAYSRRSHGADGRSGGNSRARRRKRRMAREFAPWGFCCRRGPRSRPAGSPLACAATRTTISTCRAWRQRVG